MATKQTNGTTKESQCNGEMPSRRKSTTSVNVEEKPSTNGSISNGSNSTSAPLRRKSMANGNSESSSSNGVITTVAGGGTTEYHRRKLVLDALPATGGGSPSQKPTANGTLF